MLNDIIFLLLLSVVAVLGGSGGSNGGGDDNYISSELSRPIYGTLLLDDGEPTNNSEPNTNPSNDPGMPSNTLPHAPEPATFALLGLGLLPLAFKKRP